jgi:hypothetical protein
MVIGRRRLVGVITKWLGNSGSYYQWSKWIGAKC